MTTPPSWPKRLGWLLRLTWSEAGRQPLHRMAGALSFFALFGLPALAVVLLFVGGRVYGDVPTRTRMLERVEVDFGSEARRTVEAWVEDTPRPGDGGVAAGVFGFAALLLGATVMFHHLQGVLNRIWDVRPRRRGWHRLLAVALKRLSSFALLVGTGLLVLGWLALSVLLDAFPRELARILPEVVASVVSSGLDVALTFLFVAAHLTLVFKVLPDTHVPWIASVVGAALSAALLLVARGLVLAYLRYGALPSAYGAASSLVVTLIWIYAVSLVVLLGAVFARAWTRWSDLVSAVE